VIKGKDLTLTQHSLAEKVEDFLALGLLADLIAASCNSSILSGVTVDVKQI
jgi:hypothetical protein